MVCTRFLTLVTVGISSLVSSFLDILAFPRTVMIGNLFMPVVIYMSIDQIPISFLPNSSMILFLVMLLNAWCAEMFRAR
jgi:hypothetical protein